MTFINIQHLCPSSSGFRSSKTGKESLFPTLCCWRNSAILAPERSGKKSTLHRTALGWWGAQQKWQILGESSRLDGRPEKLHLKFFNFSCLKNEVSAHSFLGKGRRNLTRAVSFGECLWPWPERSQEVVNFRLLFYSGSACHPLVDHRQLLSH